MFASFSHIGESAENVFTQQDCTIHIKPQPEHKLMELAHDREDELE